MAKMPATVRPYVAAELAESAIKGGDSSEIEKCMELCAECERIAIRIHPSYEKQYNHGRVCHDAHAMPLAVANLPIAARYLFMTRKTETFRALQAKPEGQLFRR